MEYKKRNIWSVRDLKTFIVELLKGPKRFEKVGESLPHKTAAEIVFFYHTFKKLLKLKHEIRNSREFLKMKVNQLPQGQDVSFTKQAEQILEPLTAHMKRQKIELATNGSSNYFTFNQASFQAGGSGQAGNPASSVTRNATKEAEKRMQQTQFNVEELLQVFSAANLGNGTRRRPKASIYASLHDSVISQH